MIELASLAGALDNHRARRYPVRRWLKRAAVAAIIRESHGEVEILLIERARRAGDPWSGDMALPGGRVDRDDERSASRAACRETAEEVGIVIDRTMGMGRLSDRLTADHTKRRPMIVSPFVYRAPRTFRVQTNHEIADWLWIPMNRLNEPAQRQYMTWRVGRLNKTMPYYDCGQKRRLWGLTLAILDELVGAIRHYRAAG